jgi:hypothetical protein
MKSPHGAIALTDFQGEVSLVSEQFGIIACPSKNRHEKAERQEDGAQYLHADWSGKAAVCQDQRWRDQAE